MRCLALNASFEPLTMVPVRRALRLVIEGKAEIVEAERDDLVRSERLVIPRPAIIRLVKFVHVPRRFRRQVTNTFLFARDHYRCQYCHRSQFELRHRECLTRDHLVPLSRGGNNDWTNVVTACSTCNTRKGNHLPEECGMHPLSAPHEPHFVHLSWAVRRLTTTQAKYIRLFYGESALKALGGAVEWDVRSEKAETSLRDQTSGPSTAPLSVSVPAPAPHRTLNLTSNLSDFPVNFRLGSPASRSMSRRAPRPTVCPADLTVGHGLQLTTEEALQLVEIGIGKGRHFERAHIVVAPLLVGVTLIR